ncbi:MAG: hypothetical protein RM022_031005 [Nostoc sp. EfeVER01]|uniref:hypothetical protein n=1 Tax=unclassified Nostoc TaxID=2593658 RepID=UPI002AD4A04A|nr:MULTISPECIES: hypothetical protein [unclassified Nostoc]MDZ7949108.1 hypothetical protein [Nostoc sp. EfeVER01]MDZ7950087.1 hypothetical protein [Nostoc sp. DedQUE09]MDZ7995445.1 hypothetical protein [Nostoc sp. EspVER01]
MPRGVPKTGTRKPGSGRKKKYAGEVMQKYVPISIADKLDDIYLLLIDLEKEVDIWERTCEEKITSPRYEQARKLVSVLRFLLNRLGIDTANIYADKQENTQDDESRLPVP